MISFRGLTVHKQDHIRSCEKRDKTFSNVSNLNKHLQRCVKHNLNEENTFQDVMIKCLVCDKSYKKQEKRQ